jgi:hypothetical protein
MENYDFIAEWTEFERKYPTDEIANLPLEERVSCLKDFYNLMKRHAWYNSDCRESMLSARQKIRELGEIIRLAIINSFPMDEDTMRTIFSMILLTDNELLFRVGNLEDLKERVEDLERDLEALKREVGYINHDLTKVETH